MLSCALCEKNNETLHLKVNAKECKYLMSMEVTTTVAMMEKKERENIQMTVVSRRNSSTRGFKKIN